MKSVSNISRGPNSQPPSQRGWLPKAASAAALALSLSLTACSHDYTLAWVYAPSASLTSGLINAYRVDYQNGQLTLLPDSPIPSGGRKPSGLVATPAGLAIPAIYVIHHDDSNVVSFLIGSDGKLYPQNTYDTGSFPTSVAISPDGKFLYVAYTYQAGFTTASPGPGGISVFPINADRTLGAIKNFSIGRAPVGIAVGNGGSTVYVIAQDSAATNSASTSASDTTLNLFAFSTDGSGNLTPVAGETIVSANQPSSGFATGTLPSGIATDASGTHLYVTDGTGNIVISYTTPASGIPSAIANGTAPTGLGPRGMAFDSTGKLFFVANYDGTVGEYNLGSNGAPVTSTSAASTAAGNGTTCVTVEPTRGKYLYASGSLSNSVVGEEIESDGSLRPIFHSPYEAATLPICAITVPNPTPGY
jgi:DNA-binding beta-propeller fold protein YncE